MSVAIETGKRVWTEAELQSLPEDGFDCDVVEGELVLTPKPGFSHAVMNVRLMATLCAFVHEHRLGTVVAGDTGFWMKNGNCRSPDISFVTRSRLTELGFKRSTRTFFPGAPDLAVEILSPNNTRREIDDRLRDFLESGTQLAWVIDPDQQRVEVCHSLTQRTLIGTGGFLDGEHLLPGFRYPIADLFKEWDWE